MKSIFVFLLLLLGVCSTADGLSINFKRLADSAKFNVLHYDIHIEVDPRTTSINGYNTISFKMLNKAKAIAIDLAKHFEIEKVMYGNKKATYFRDGNKILILPERKFKKDKIYKVSIYYRGVPEKAILAPWKGGFDWKEDRNGKPWVGLACESKGAAIWMPCKDDWSDEADSMDMHLTVPDTLVGVSNGRLISSSKSGKGLATYHWKVVNPINNYNISINIGDYVHIQDVYNGKKTLTLDYYVLKYNRDKAIKHFKEVDTMLRAFEQYFGPYPFAEDGFKLVETPYWGMEHQSCVAYGNKYKYNEFGFDFIIVHESGHEWFANSITAADPADMWIHESFTTYSETLFLEYTQGKERSLEYLNTQLSKVKAEHSMLGQRGIQFHDWKDNDIYYKGAWMLQTLRYSLNNDSLFLSTIREMCDTFRHKLIVTEDVINFFNRRMPKTYSGFFMQYLSQAKIPALKVEFENREGKRILKYKLEHCKEDFELPVLIPNTTLIIHATTIQKEMEVPSTIEKGDLKKLEKYVLVKVE